MHTAFRLMTIFGSLRLQIASSLELTNAPKPWFYAATARNALSTIAASLAIWHVGGDNR